MWLPIDPTIFAGQLSPVSPFQTVVNLPEPIGSPNDATAIPILHDRTLQDNTPGQNDTTTTMRDLAEGQDYFLDRVVGKVWANLQQDPGPVDAILKIIVCMAIAVFPVNDGGDQIDLENGDFQPLLARNAMGPWLWRRTWILYNMSQGALDNGQDESGPRSIGDYGSNMDGGHVDAKTRRRVTQNQRLFLVMQAMRLGEVGEPGGTGALSFGFELRAHGAMRRHRNKSVFS